MSKPAIEELKEALEDLTSEGFMSISDQSIKLNNALTELSELRGIKELHDFKYLEGVYRKNKALQTKLDKAKELISTVSGNHGNREDCHCKFCSFILEEE